MMAHRPATNIAVLDCEISEIRLLLERYAGVLIEKPAERLADSIACHVAARHMNSASELLARLKSAPQECDQLLEALLVPDTAFFRSPVLFEAFERRVLPAIKAHKAAQDPRSLRIWSAGCSSGEEAYSIAISVCEGVGNEGGWNIHIVASDIRLPALSAAERGVYPDTALENVPKHLVASYFSRVGDHFLVKPRLRNLVTFTPMNLAQASFIGRFDCIFCMDVLPHFSTSQRAALTERIHHSLEPGGYLFLGQKEKLPTFDRGLTPQLHLASTYYQRPLPAARNGKI